MSYTPRCLGHVNIFVRDAARSRQWYADVLGLHTYDFVPGRAAFMTADLNQSHEVALIQIGAEAAGPRPGQVGLNHMAWMMASLDDLRELYARLEARGVAIERVADHGISIGVYFRDPDGNGVEASYELPRSQWPLGEEVFSSAARPRGLFPGPWDAHGVESQLLAR